MPENGQREMQMKNSNMHLMRKLIKHFIEKRPAQVIQITNKCNLNNSTSKNMNLHMFDSETTTHKITFDYNAINISFRNIKLFFSFCLFVCEIKFDIVA